MYLSTIETGTISPQCIKNRIGDRVAESIAENDFSAFFGVCPNRKRRLKVHQLDSGRAIEGRV